MSIEKVGLQMFLQTRGNFINLDHISHHISCAGLETLSAEGKT
jgi:hypothetical protein